MIEECARCRRPAAMLLVAVRPRSGRVTGEYPARQPLCAGCVAVEVRVADEMGYVPVGEAL